MRHKCIILLCSTLVTTLVLLQPAVLAGDENNPEIVDIEKDVKMWMMIKGPLVNTLFKNADILSCWFHENSETPDNVYITIKLRDFKFCYFNISYTVQWSYLDMEGFIILGNQLKQQYMTAYAGYAHGSTMYRFETTAEIDETENTLTITIPKEYIGNPEPGHQLIEPIAAAIVRPNLEFTYTRPILSILAYDDAMNGKTYTIQY